MSDDKDFEGIMAGLGDVLAYVRGEADQAGYRVHVPADVDVRAIRRKTGLTQAAFAGRYGFSVAAVRDWEQRRRRPEVSARILLKVIELRPEVVEEALRDIA